MSTNDNNKKGVFELKMRLLQSAFGRFLGKVEVIRKRHNEKMAKTSREEDIRNLEAIRKTLEDS